MPGLGRPGFVPRKRERDHCSGACSGAQSASPRGVMVLACGRRSPPGIGLSFDADMTGEAHEAGERLEHVELIAWVSHHPCPLVDSLPVRGPTRRGADYAWARHVRVKRSRSHYADDCSSAFGFFGDGLAFGFIEAEVVSVFDARLFFGVPARVSFLRFRFVAFQ